MDLPSPTLSKKISRTESTLYRDDLNHFNIDLNDSKDPMVQRCVIIQKDEKGYGLTVSGDNPVFVQSVKDDGAAARAGVQQGDRIIKVNGTLVTQSNHQEVVELIKSGSYVALTLLGKPPGQGKGLSPQHSFSLPGTNFSVMNSNKSDCSERITGPQPVDPEKQQQLTNSRIHTIRKMLEKEVVYLENLRQEFSKTPSEKMRAEVNGTVKRVKTLEEQLCNLTGLQHEQIITRSPKSPTSGRHFHDRESCRSISFPSHGIHNRSLIHQISAPLLPASQAMTSPPVIPLAPVSSDTKYQVILSPCNDVEKNKPVSPDKKQSISTSLENLAKHLNPRSTTWPQPTHTRQSSSPETLRGFENIKCQKSNGCPRPDPLRRSPSSVSPPQGFYRNLMSNLETKLNFPSASQLSSLSQHDSAIESPGPSPPPSPTELNDSNKIPKDLPKVEEFTHQLDELNQQETIDDFGIQPLISKLNQNTNIICMEDEDLSSDTELGHLEDHGPFNGLWKLVRNPAHLSVFLHYLMSNSDPSSLFFYLISELYEQGTGKDMKKWAYEIHSSFLVPGAPLKVSLVDETILHEIDDVLLNSIDKEETLRTVFRKARKKAKEELNDFLADFRNKRTMGLANIFGPPDYQLEEAMHDKNKEQKIIEQLLCPCLENFSEDLEGVDDRSVAKTYALATILKQFGVKNQQYASIIEKCPTFVGKEQSFITSLLKRNKKVILMQGHHFVPEHYYCVTYCNHCQLIIWGVGHQGYQCQNCEMNIHKSCIKVVEEYCIGALRNKKERTKERTRKDRKSGIVENIIAKTRKPSQPVPAAIEKAKRLNEEMNAENALNASDSFTLKDGSRGFDHLKEPSDIVFQNMLNLSESVDKPHHGNKKSASSIGRSESFRQTRESKPSFRKRSDPNIPRSKSDVDVDDKNNLGLNESKSSSNSSLSNRSLDSPSNSSEMVHRTPTSVSVDSAPPNVTSVSGMLSGSHGLSSMDDSDLEADADPPNWQENVNWDELKVMKPKEKKRQDVINELFHTERTHVRNLKVLDRLFYKPMLQEQLLPSDFLNLLFPNLEEMLEIHTTFNNKMKARRKEEPVIGDIGQLMLERFDGAAGDHLKQAAATYCQNQSIALENLKSRQKKDTKLALSLADAEANNLCRRLQLKDIIASGFQRLTKYPLLLENIAKYTSPNTQELSDLQRAVECSKEILVHVDSAIKESENMHRLLDIQNKMDKSLFEKIEKVEKNEKEKKNEINPIVENFKNLDVTQHRLLHEGSLLWRLSKQKNVEMHVVLLEDILILFQKQDEKYVLKFHNTNLNTGREDIKIMHSPILRVQNLFTRDNATDKRTFFIISSSEMHAMYEFVAGTALEKKIWCTHIDKAAQEQKKRNMLKNNLEAPHPVTDVLTPTEEPLSSEVETDTKESENPVESNKEPDSSHKEDEPSDNLPVSDPEQPEPREPPDGIPQRARQFSAGEEPGDSGERQKPYHRIERIEILEIMEGPQLIEPNEVIVTGPVCEIAEPVLTPLEKLRRKDIEISKAIEEKEKITSEILNIPLEDLKNISEKVIDDVQSLSSVELATSAVQLGNKLSSIVSGSLNIEETMGAFDAGESLSTSEKSKEDQEMSSPKKEPKSSSIQSLLSLSASLNQCLTQLMVAVNNAEEEKKLLRSELAVCQEQIHQMHESHRHCFTQSSSVHSRPSSFVSVSSTTSDGTGEYFEVPHLFSVLEKTEESVDSDIQSPIYEDVPKSPQFSSPINESALQPKSCNRLNESVDRTCDPLSSNCDVRNIDSGEVPCTSDQKTEKDTVENTEEVLDSYCRTFDEQHKVDPVYL
ncbi:rho guanine nucleotide exchange factor 11 isoform X2 [Parasteatoda tepidariorum]|uniref:rho guanine nucleotide exchange factor 11 isoform X2 n=1 Tax=Parasteatoda tepidariorum TaxID=114398 RepID=UPI001C71B670|nr:rho guanine nucleotide exchange factor 11 isoform X2 [Parasteatoda tepidariorum]